MGEATLALAITPQSSASFEFSEHSTTAAFIILVWEAVITIGDEVTYIWPKSRGAYIKWMFLFAKYFTLAMQTIVSWFQLDFIPHNAIPISQCRVYRGLQVAGAQLVMMVFDLVLLLRIYALYQRNSMSSWLGTFAVGMEWFTAITGISVVFPGISYDHACMAVNYPRKVVVIVVGTLVPQTILLWLAYRRKETIVRAERGRRSVASVTIRDGVIAFVCVTALFIVLLGSQLSGNSTTNVIAVIDWFPVGISIATCRLIMNLQRAHTVPESHPPEDLSTQIWEPDYEMQSRSRPP